MDKFLNDMKRNWGFAECFLEWIEELPRKAQILALTYMDYLNDIGRLNTPDEILTCGFKCNSPIETLFYLAFFIYDQEYCRTTGKINTDYSHFGYTLKSFLGLDKQYEINVDGKKYISDFGVTLIDVKCTYDENGKLNIIDNSKDLRILIECDGHEFHQKTKKQVEYDNERQLALQTAGYEVIRFSGSQIYKDPLGCAEKAYEYIVSRIERGSKEHGRC